MNSFNPYRVFKFVATSCDWASLHRSGQFQSLSGFQVRCNFLPGWLRTCPSRGFNPYRVFKFVATHLVPGHAEAGFLVSIPIGFSSSLQRSRFVNNTNYKYSFQSLSGFQVRCNGLPVGVLVNRPTEFQSLSGFQVRCNSAQPATCRMLLSQFQSLSGFQVRCNHTIHQLLASIDSVSIPIGFSSSLQPRLPVRMSPGPS